MPKTDELELEMQKKSWINEATLLQKYNQN